MASCLAERSCVFPPQEGQDYCYHHLLMFEEVIELGEKIETRRENLKGLAREFMQEGTQLSRILRCVVDGLSTCREIAEHTGISTGAVASCISMLAERGLIRTVGFGRTERTNKKYRIYKATSA